jgi:hypothetical protein
MNLTDRIKNLSWWRKGLIGGIIWIGFYAITILISDSRILLLEFYIKAIIIIIIFLLFNYLMIEKKVNESESWKVGLMFSFLVMIINSMLKDFQTINLRYCLISVPICIILGLLFGYFIQNKRKQKNEKY